MSTDTWMPRDPKAPPNDDSNCVFVIVVVAGNMMYGVNVKSDMWACITQQYIIIIRVLVLKQVINMLGQELNFSHSPLNVQKSFVSIRQLKKKYFTIRVDLEDYVIEEMGVMWLDMHLTSNELVLIGLLKGSLLRSLFATDRDEILCFYWIFGLMRDEVDVGVVLNINTTCEKSTESIAQV